MEDAVLGSACGSVSGRAAAITTSDRPDFGPNVHIFDPSMSTSAINYTLAGVFSGQESNQFGAERYGVLFKPGTYTDIDANLGFYTSVAGLGLNPGDVEIAGNVHVEADWAGGNATQNFWRSVENMAVTALNGDFPWFRWAVSQAAPMRRMHIRSPLNLNSSNFGWASGGYIADSAIDGFVLSGSQQQWITRNSVIGGWSNGSWNQVFSGVVGAPPQSFSTTPRSPQPYTTLETSPVTQEKPYLYVDQNGRYSMFVPALSANSSGISWGNGPTPGTSVPLSRFFVARPSDSAATINDALQQGLNLIFTPGIYHVDQTIRVTRPHTIVYGMGMATMVPDNGVVAMRAADADGVKISGLLFDAGPVNSPVLLHVGDDMPGDRHGSDPTVIHDVFFRIGGSGPGKATTSLVVNSNDTIVDHVWIWRADHGTGVGWTINTADTGMIVNGNNLTAYGLFVEHYQKYEVIWNGNNGRVIFFQNEMPYDPPNQAAWMNGTKNGYAAFKVADTVTDFEGWGMGSYCYFNVNPAVNAYHAFEVPNMPGVQLHDVLTVSLGGVGTITHVVNDTGATAEGESTTPVNIVSYP